MDITVSSRHVEVSPTLRATTVDKVNRLSKYLEGMDRAEVRFDEERNPRIANGQRCEVTLYGHGQVVRTKCAAADHFAAVDGAVDKLERQLTRLKKRLVTREQGKVHNAPKVAAPGAEVDVEALAEHLGNGVAPLDLLDEVPAEVGAPDGPTRAPRITKTKRFTLRPMSPEEAVLQLELVGHQFYVFRHADTGDASVVYRRDDNDYGLIQANR